MFIALSVCPAIGNEWARKMFELTNHDFGTLARGAKAEFDFVLENKFEEDIHIASVRTSCACTTPEIVKETLKTWEKGAIRAKFNTRTFIGSRSATITVVIDKPFAAEVQLTVKGYIRRDIVFEPGAVEFGAVDVGNPAEQTVRVKYAGRGDWRIEDIQGPNYYEIKLVEDQRDIGRVLYSMEVKLSPQAPSGYLMDQLILVTNDQRLKRVPLSVNGRIRDSLTVSPLSLSLGVLRPGETATKQLVVRAKQPFHVVEIGCAEDEGFSFITPSDAKKLHLIPVSFTAGQAPGNIAKTIRIKTDLGDGSEASCLATATVKAFDG
jgi:hypothetical protein